MIKELNFELTKSDIENSYLKICNSATKGIGKFQIFGLIIIFALLLILAVYTGDIWLSVIIFFVFFILAIMPKKKSFVKIFGKVETRKIFISLNSEDENFICKEAIGYTVIHWGKVPKIDNNQHSLLIFTSNNSAYIIPKRIFSSENECNEVWNLIQECFNKSR